MDRVLPVAAELASWCPERTIFTRFIPPERPDQMPGMWQRYYTRWRVATRECVELSLLELMRPLAAFCPPATVIDKTRYSAFAEPTLLAHLQKARGRRVDRLGLRDRCLGSGDRAGRGRPRLPRHRRIRDAVCSSSDEGHDMLMRLYHSRFTEQIETATAAAILARWR